MISMFYSVLLFNRFNHKFIFQGIRQMFGCNDNPSARQFESAWRKLLGQHQIKASDSANCQENDFQFLNVLNVSSRKQNLDGTAGSNVNGFEDNFDEFDLEIEDPVAMDTIFSTNLDDDMAAYLASVLQKNIIEGRWFNPLRCQNCLQVFSEGEIVDDDFVKLKMKTSKLKAPAKSTVDICLETEMVMRSFNYEAGKLQKILESVLLHLNINELFWASDFSSHDEPDHKINLIKLIIEMYVKKKQEYISKCKTLAAHDTVWRSVLRKLIHFRGQ